MGSFFGIGRVCATPGLLPPGVRVQAGATELTVDEWFYRARGYRPSADVLPMLDARPSSANENGPLVDETERVAKWIP